MDEPSVLSQTSTARLDPFAAGEAGGRVVRGAGLRTLGLIVTVLAGAISAPLMVRHLGPIDFGRYYLVSSILFVATALSEGGLANVAIRAYATANGEERRRLIANLSGLRLVIDAVMALLAIGFGLAAGYDRDVVIGLAISSVALVLAAQQGTLTVILQGSLRLGPLALTEAFRALLTAALIAALVLAGGGLIPFFGVQPLVWAAALALTFWLARGERPRRPAFERSQWRVLGQETALFAVASVLGALYPQITLIAMSLLESPAVTGTYSIAARIVDIVGGLPWILAGSVLPLLAATVGDRERLRYIVRRVFEGSAIVGGLVAIAVVIGARFGIDIVATSGPSGRPSVPVLRIMGAGTTAMFLAASLGFVLLAQRRHRELVIVNAVAFGLAIVLAVTLISALGAKGGAITTAVLPLVLATTYAALLIRSGIALPLGFLARLAIALAAGMGAGAALLLVHPVPAVLVAATLYMLLLWRMNAIPHEMITTLEQLARRRRPA